MPDIKSNVADLEKVSLEIFRVNLKVIEQHDMGEQTSRAVYD
jgi:hypothetical protein